MRIPHIPYDYTDLIFRVAFSLIFLGLGSEHLFRDDVIQMIMPDWLGPKRVLSIIAGLVVVSGGTSILLGWHLRQGAAVLASFLVVVTLLIHVPALFWKPEGLSDDYYWLWRVFQLSNLMKNVCLFGGCVHFLNHEPGRFSIDGRRAARAAAR